MNILLNLLKIFVNLLLLLAVARFAVRGAVAANTVWLAEALLGFLRGGTALAAAQATWESEEE